jgi:ketosteroid isomerase-like protein
MIAMSEQAKAAQRLYDALAARDPAAVLDALHEDFVGDVSAGMPLDVGGRHAGPQAMLEHVWVPVFAHYDMSVEPDELLPSGDDRLVAVGRYRGVERASGRRVDAAFAHVFTLRDGRIAALRQVTDTRRW